MLALGLALGGCTTTGPSAASSSQVDKRHAIDVSGDATLARLYGTAGGSRELVAKARGILIFPSVIDAGLGIGGQYGQGELRVGGVTTGYYSTATGSIGWQIGAQSRAIVFLFMTQQALDQFRNNDGWSAGGDATVVVLNVGANGNIDTTTATSQVYGFALTNDGLMIGASFQGTKVTRLQTL